MNRPCTSEGTELDLVVKSRPLVLSTWTGGMQALATGQLGKLLQ
jgi:hypothetical protein